MPIPISFPKQLRDRAGRFGGAYGVEWQGLDLIASHFESFGEKMQAVREETADRLAEAAETYMQNNAPWQDRTGAARDSLHAEAVHEKNVSTVWLGYGPTIFYAGYLENYIYNGVSYAIIGPTIDYFRGAMGEYISESGIIAGVGQ